MCEELWHVLSDSQAAQERRNVVFHLTRDAKGLAWRVEGPRRRWVRSGRPTYNTYSGMVVTNLPAKMAMEKEMLRACMVLVL